MMMAIDKSTTASTTRSTRRSARIGLSIKTNAHQNSLSLPLDLPGSSLFDTAPKSPQAAEAPPPPPTANSIQFPSCLQKPSFSSTCSANNNRSLSLSSTATSSSSSSSSFIQNIRSFQPPEAHTLRHSSASLSNFLNRSSHSTQQAGQDDHPHSTLTATQIQRYLRAQPATAPSCRSPAANSIQFPSSPMTSSPRWDDSAAAHLVDQFDDPHDAFDRLIHHWLTNQFEPAELIHPHSIQSLVPELDILVGFKAITDRLNLPQLERHQVWEALRLVFPSATSWARPTPPGLRSNQEHVVIGIKPKSTSSEHPGPPKTRQAPDASINEQTYPFDKLDFKKPIPSRIHSTELIEYMRQRICELEPKQNPKVSRMPFSKAKSTTRPSQAGNSSKKHYYAPLRLFRFDHRHPPLISDESGRDLVNLLGHRIWISLIQACKNTKDDFQAGEVLVASWMENMNKFEFDLICKNSKSSETQISETTSKKIIRIAYPFQKKHQVIKLFKSQPFEHFNSIVFSDDRRQLNVAADQHTGSSPRKVALKDFTIVQISIHPVLNRDQKREQSKFSSLSKGTLSKLMMNPTARDDKKTSDELDLPQYEKRRGKSLDLINNPMINANPGPLMDHQTVLESDNNKDARLISSFFGQINQNFHHKRKSLTLEKIFSHQPPDVKQASPDPADLIPAYNTPSSSSNTPASTLILQEIAIEFNLLCLNQLKIQIKVLQQEVA
ncbi:hypothetical protein PGTUg99_010334 [Puccinia graminis f. sp. tritici]|uniref:Uncharacterized protein n=1 Tax=Puccinia graminis f. sp. tritici TaxID=56615 RepID=A0A5B0RRG1_PUCGR|nr:hypothetical protein PGTUg99_010334 [Puccinia graminis f. sp. tritici]